MFIGVKISPRWVDFLYSNWLCVHGVTKIDDCKQCRPRCDAVLCSISSGSTLFAKITFLETMLLVKSRIFYLQ